LLGRGTGPLECSRRLGLSLNTVKRYARAAEPERMIRAPQYQPTLVDHYREHCARGGRRPAVPVILLLTEIKAMGHPWQHELPYRYLAHGRAEADRPHLSPRLVARLLLSRPGYPHRRSAGLLDQFTAACPEMTALAALIRSSAAMLRPAGGNTARLAEWIQATRAADLPHLHAFTRGLDLDLPGRPCCRHPSRSITAELRA